MPRYDPDKESETYLQNGAYLAPSDASEPAGRTADRVFTRRVEGSFERIVRRGEQPDDYWWEVTAQDGGFAGFEAQTAWAGSRPTDDFTDSSSVSGGGHAFLGVGDSACINHVGAQTGGSAGNTTTKRVFLDVNGDGLPDRIADDGHVDFNRFDLAKDTGSNRVDHSNAKHKIDMPTSQWVLSEVTVDDGRSHTYTTRFNYFNDAYYDRAARQSYGYARFETTLPDLSKMDRHFHNQSFYLRHLPHKEVRKDADGRLYTLVKTRYRLHPVGPLSVFPARVASRTSFYEGTTSHENAAPKSTSLVRPERVRDSGLAPARRQQRPAPGRAGQPDEIPPRRRR